jgi:hypothetical protein
MTSKEMMEILWSRSAAWLLLISPLICAGWACDNQEYAFVDRPALMADSLNGWLPPCLPASATNIKMRSNMDTRELWMKFSFQASDQQTWTKQLSAADADVARGVLNTPPWHVLWWDLDEPGSPAVLAFVPCNAKAGEGPAYFFVEKQSGYYYSR